MANFDAPTREECTAERSISNTPLQALTLLNDPSFVEAAKVFGVRILSSQTKGDVERITFAFQESFSRSPNSREQKVLLKLLAQQRRHYLNDPTLADHLLDIGISKVPKKFQNTEVAAWTSVARALLNKHEFVMRY
jgi:hypothetical protein